LIAITEFRAGASWRPRIVQPADALLALLANTVHPRLQPRATLATLRQVVNHARAVKSLRGEAREVARALLDDVKSSGAVAARAASA
jgi:hypothetical protein